MFFKAFFFFFQRKSSLQFLAPILPLLANWPPSGCCALSPYFLNTGRSVLGMRLSPGLCPQLIFCNPVLQACFHVVVKPEHDPSLVTMDGLVLLGRPIPCSRTFNLLVAICHDCDLFPYSDYFLDAPSTQTSQASQNTPCTLSAPSSTFPSP